MIRVAILTTDCREHFRQYDRFEPYFGPAPAALLQGLAQMDQVELHIVSCLQQPVQSPETLADNTHYHGLHVPKWGWLKTGYMGCARAVRRTLHQIKPDLVHGQGTERDCALNAVRSGFPSLVTVHGNMRRVAKVNRAPFLSYLWIMARLEGWAVPRADGILCISHYTQALLENEARRTWVVPNAVDESYFHIPADPGQGGPALCVGTICAHKNQNRLIRELDSLTETLPVHFLGGMDDASEYAREFLHLVEQRDWCHYLGHADRGRLQEALAGASMLLLPSLEDNCPMVVLESMAAGLPVVAVRVGGLPDLVDPEVTGCLVDQEDWSGFRAGIQRLRQSGSLRRTLGRAGRDRAKRLFHPRVVAARHLEVYTSLLGHGGKGPVG